MMNWSGIFSGSEMISQYVCAIGKKKAENKPARLFLLGIAAGAMIALGAVTAATASFAVENPGLARLVAGLLFPFGLGMVMLTGAELFTGNTMLLTSVLGRGATLGGMLKNWLCVYLGNFAGALLVAVLITSSGQPGLGGGALAVSIVRTAVNKSGIAFLPAVTLGVLCNILVCLGVLCSLTAKDTAGRILGAYIPVVFFIIGGFEHCVANMYYIPAGMLAMRNPEWAALAAQANLNTAALTLGNLFLANLLPVTIGNILGGAGISTILWLGHGKAINNNSVSSAVER